jgi:hypothetical protein
MGLLPARCGGSAVWVEEVCYEISEAFLIAAPKPVPETEITCHRRQIRSHLPSPLDDIVMPGLVSVRALSGAVSA